MVGQPEAPEAAAPEVMGGKDVHDGQDQEQHNSCEACKMNMTVRQRSRALRGGLF